MSAATVAFAKAARGNILVASSRAGFRKQILKSLDSATTPAIEAAGGADALMMLAESNFRTLLLDPLIEDLDVEELVATIRVRHPRLNVVVLESEKDAGQLSLNLAETASEDAARDLYRDNSSDPGSCKALHGSISRK